MGWIFMYISDCCLVDIDNKEPLTDATTFLKTPDIPYFLEALNGVSKFHCDQS